MRIYALSAEMIRTGLVVVAFVLLSRQLTLEEVGIVSAITAALAILGPLATLGLPFRILRDSASEGSGLNYRNALATLCLGLAPVVSLVCLALVQSYGRSAGLLAVSCILIAECWLLMSFHIVTSYALGGLQGQVLLMANVFSSSPRFIASLLLLVVPNPSAQLYGLALLLLSVPATFMLVKLLPKQGKLAFLPLHTIFGEKKAGGLSMTSALLSRCSDDLDKLFLGSLRGASELAMYAVPYRLTFFAMIPSRAFLSSKMSGWYRREGRGIKAELLSVGSAATVAGAACSTLLYLCWPLLTTYIIGEKFASAQPLILIFGIAVVVRSVHYCIGEVLFARSAMIERNVVQLLAVTSGVVFMVVIIPYWGIYGAGSATVLMEILMLVGYTVVLYAKK